MKGLFGHQILTSVQPLEARTTPLLSRHLSSRLQNASDMPETITSRDAARFPIIASCTLLGLYLFFKVSPLPPVMSFGSSNFILFCFHFSHHRRHACSFMENKEQGGKIRIIHPGPTTQGQPLLVFGTLSHQSLLHGAFLHGAFCFVFIIPVWFHCTVYVGMGLADVSDIPPPY